MYCWTVRECCPFAEVDCITLVETYINCETIGGGAPGGGGGSGGGPGWSGGPGGQGGGPGGSTPPPDFTDILTQNIPVSVFIANGGVLPPGFTEELAKKLQEYYQQNTVTQEEYYYLLANPNVIPLLLDFCTQFPTPPSDGTIQGTALGEPYDPYQDESNLCNFFRNIVFTCQLDAPQAKWLANSTPDVMQLHAFLNEHQWDAASKQTVQWYANANAKGVFPHFTADDNIIDPALIAEFVINVAKVRTECPQCGDGEVFLKATWRTIGGYVHAGLSICGLIPVGGEPCNLVDGVLYTIEGDLMSASLSFAESLPIAGWFATGAKYAGLAILVGQIEHVLQFTRVGNIIEFGDKGVLRKVMGIVSDNHEAHHIVPWALRENELVQHAAKGRFHMNHPDNGIELEKFRIATGTGTHANHPQYNIKVEAKVNELWQRLQNHYGAGAVPVEVARVKLIELENSIRNHIISNPTVKINDLTLNGVNVPTVP
ncbi:MAG: AHH domain-containing protein [Saprospiraceae bacterium]|nr:AHH domain-containing protein [Saprospiraceae bacterium]